WGRHVENKTERWDVVSCCNESPGADNRILPYDNIVQERGAHSDRAMGFDRTAVQHRAVTDRNVVPEDERTLISHDMANRAVLNIRVPADADHVHVTSNHTVVPNAGMIAD